MTGAPSLSINGLHKRFGRTEALRGLDLDVPRGSIFGLVGLNGAGKTTTLECALGLRGFDGGTIRILGLAPRELCRSDGRVGVVFDTPLLPQGLRVRAVLEHAYFVAGRGGRGPGEVLVLFGLERLARRRVRQLSLGNRRRLSIATALLGEPELIVLDEPFSGLDAGGVEDLLEILRSLRATAGATILLSSHQLHQVEAVSTHLAVIHHGATIVQGPLGDVLDPRRRRVTVRVSDSRRALERLQKTPGVRAAREVDGGRIDVELDQLRPAELNALLVRAGVEVEELVQGRPTLAAYFRERTGRER